MQAGLLSPYNEEQSQDAGNKVFFFKDFLILKATALIFKLNQDIFITFIEFEYGSHSPLIEGVLKNKHIMFFVLILVASTL